MTKPYRLGLYEKSMPNGLALSKKLLLTRESGFDYLELSIDETDEKLARLDWDEETLSQRLNVKLMNYMRNLPLDNHKKDIAKIAHLSLKEINDFIAKHPEILKLSISFVEEQ